MREDNDYIEQPGTVENSVQDLCECFFVFPFRVLWNGHLFFLAYLALVLGGTYYVATTAIFYLTKYFGTIYQEFPFAEKVLILALQGLVFLIWFFTIPLLLTAIALPMREIWNSGHISFVRLLRMTPQTAAQCFNTIKGLGRPLVYIAAAPLAIFVIYKLTQHRIEHESLDLVLIISGVAVALTAIIKAIPMTMAPIVTIVAQMRPEASIQTAINGLFPKRFLLALTLLGGAAAIAGFVQIMPLLDSVLSRSDKEIALLTASLMAVWYSFSVISMIVIKRVVEIEKTAAEHRAHLQANQPQIEYNTPPTQPEPAGFHANGNLNVYIEKMRYIPPEENTDEEGA